MRFHPTRIHLAYLCTFFLSVLLNLACSKDSDLLRDAILQDQSVSSVEELDSTEPDSEDIEESIVEEEIVEQTIDLTRTTSFPPIHDAHVQSGKGYNQNLIRLEEDSRTSYLMFDLSPISDINGSIASVTLQLTINGDDGNGSIKIHKGTTNDWTEGSLSENTAPEYDIELGSITKEFPLDATELIELDSELINPDVHTLVLSHVGGNDIAFASKEHPDKIGPKLVVSYNAPEGSEEIIIEEDTTGDNTDITEDTKEEEEQPENQEPMAIADANPSAGGVPLEVTFSGSNSSDDNEITSYSWNFKDGTSATTANPTHTFTEVGVYEVELSVTDAEGLSSTDKVTITVTEEQNNAPQAIVSATPTSGEAPLTVSFKGSSSTDDHSIASYGWDFKDGSKTNVADFSYTYANPGVYEAELTVTDENGLTDQESITITVTEPQNTAPVAVVGANITSGTVPLQVQFSGSNSTDDKGITKYSWDFKNGSTSSTANPINTFNQPGSYPVELTVTDANGLTDKKSIAITVTAPNNQAPVAVSTPSVTSGEAPLTVSFIGDKSTDDNGVTSYSWNFKDGSTSTEANPSHTFQNSGTYQVELTVTDADGTTDTDTDTITVTAPSNTGGSGNNPPGFYVTPNGNSSNSGTSESSAWSLEHAFSAAKPGDIVYVKAGTYNNQNPVNYTSGYSSSPIKFIGYKNTPGDVVSNQNSTFSYGQSLNANNMPLMRGSSSLQGMALDLNGSFLEIHNFQITNYQIGINTKGRNVLLKNVVVTNSGEQNNRNSQTGRGFQIFGDNTVVENCFILNSNAEGINLKGANNCIVRDTKVYSDNVKNMTGYYIMISEGGRNNLIERSIVSRDARSDNSSNPHQGHGLVMKNQAVNNTVRNCKAYNTGVEVNFSGVHSNTFENIEIIGKYSTYNGQFSACIKVNNGAHDNTFRNITIKDARYAIAFIDFDDGFTGAGGDENQGGNNNKFININADGLKNIMVFNSAEVGWAATSKNNQFSNSTFKNVSSIPFVTSQTTSGTKFTNCTFQNIPHYKMKELNDGASNVLPIVFESCQFNNVGFSIPN